MRVVSAQCVDFDSFYVMCSVTNTGNNNAEAPISPFPCYQRDTLSRNTGRICLVRIMFDLSVTRSVYRFLFVNIFVYYQQLYNYTMESSAAKNKSHHVNEPYFTDEFIILI